MTCRKLFSGYDAISIVVAAVFFIDLVEKQILNIYTFSIAMKKNRDYHVVKIARSPQLFLYVIEDIFLSNATYNK